MNYDKRLPDLYSYFDYRKYLADYYRNRKEFDPGFSHTYICYRLGQRNSKSYFANVINGTRNMSSEFISRMIDLLDFDTEKANYFRALVNYNQTTNQNERDYYFDQLIERSETEKRLISSDEYAFYKEWHHGVIRALLDIHNISDNYESIARIIRPALTVRQVKKSIHLLESLKLIEKNPQGYYKPTQKSVKTEDFVRDELIERYQIECLEMAKTVLMNKDDQPREISTNILSISEEGLKKIQDKLLKFREEVRAIVHGDEKPADRIYQLDIQLFPNSSCFSSKKRYNE